MNDRTVITWSVENWVTIVLMVFIAGVVINIIRAGVHKVTMSSTNSDKGSA